MRVLLDENLPRAFASELKGHRVRTVQSMGWSGTKNGELLRRADGRFDVLLTMDRGFQHQQNLGVLGVRVVIIRASSGRLVHLRPLVGEILGTLEALPPGEWREIGDSGA
ncbi:MAG: DUF5615 family PIN-like protein [Chloroflexi bacterium]|nr:DUF5615 family PIN-like protein [Chloroflexota bacterium]